MDILKNPFSPGAGSPPPELVGRDKILMQGAVLLARIRKQRPEKSLLLTGLRGVGKTVLLNEIERRAREAGYRTIAVEAAEGKTLGALLAPHLKRLLFDLDRMAGAGEKAKRGLAVLRSFLGTLKLTISDMTFGLDIAPERGSADSGDLEFDLANVFVAVAEASLDRGTSVALFIDEIQYFSQEELGALIMTMHRLQQRRLPFALVGAGLPILPGLAGNAKSYAERLFSFPRIDALSEEDTVRALQDPAHHAGVAFEPAALAEIFRQTKGYPYFLQEWGYQAWNLAATSPITVQTVRDATNAVIPELDENFFRVRYDRLTPKERIYLRAMAQIGPGASRTSEIAALLGVTVRSLGPVRAKLINKGMIYSPAHGDMAFTVPLFDTFMMRAIPAFEPWEANAPDR